MGKKGKQGGNKKPDEKSGSNAPPSGQKATQNPQQAAGQPGPSGDPGVQVTQKRRDQPQKQHQIQPQQQGPGGGQQQQQRQPQQEWGAGGEFQQQQRPQGGQQQQKQPQQQWGAGGSQQRDRSQQQWGPGGGQQQQQRQPQQEWGAGGEFQQQQRPQGGQQQQKQPQQQWGAGGSQQRGRSQQQWGGPGGGQQQQQRQPQQTLGAGGEFQQQQRPQGGQQQQKQPQQQWGAGGSQQRDRSQQQWGPGGGQQQQQRQPQQEWGAGGEFQQQQRPQGGQQQQKQPQQQWGAGGSQQRDRSQQQQGPGGGQQQQQRQPQQEWGAGGEFQQQQRPQGGQQQQKQPQQQWGAGGSQQRDRSQQQQGPGGGQQQQQRQPQQEWGAGGSQQRDQPQQQQRQPKQQWGAGGDSQQRGQPQYQSRSSAAPDISKKFENISVSGKPQGRQQPTVERKSAAIKGITSDYFIQESKGLVAFSGTDGSKHEIEANYVKVNIDKMPKVAFQYDVKFNPDKPLRIRSDAFEEFRIGVLGANRKPRNYPIAFDGMNIAFAAEQVPAEFLNRAHAIKFVDSETNAAKEVEITIMEAVDANIDLTLLESYKKTGIKEGLIRVLQCLDVVLRTAPAKMSRQAGRAFYQPPPQDMDLGDGFVLWLGLFQSLSLGDSLMLNIDIAHKGFPRASNLVDVYQENRDRTDQYLKNLNIIYDPPKSMNGISKLYRANGLTQPASRLTFENEHKQMMTVQEYYKSKNYEIKNPNLPCVSVGARGIALPLELCTIQSGQDVRKRAGPNQIRNLIKYAATATDIRKKKIMDLFRGFNYNGSEIIKGFNISLGSEFIKLIARNIQPPKIQYANGLIVPQRGSWRADSVSFLKASELTKWAILVTADRFDVRKAGEFGKRIIEEAKRNKMKLDENYKMETEKRPQNLYNVFERLKKENYSIVFVIISGFGNIYAQVKQRAEIDFGILTQCVKTNTLERRLDSSTIANIFLKVNSKLNGTNHTLQTVRKLPINDTNMAVMFLGADVTHPSPDQSFIPSVVGVVGSYDPHAYHYKISWRLQDPRAEMIKDMENIMTDQLQNFMQKRGKYPSHIIYYRDGVSNGQFAELNRVELNAINKACAKIPNYKPKVTCLVVQKRHHTRFFPASPGITHKFDRNKNVLPGTVVDTTITHPGQKQFFLVSHESIQGTAKPTKYCIIRDDANFDADDLQGMTYSLCHLFTRCNRAVSYPAPAYYAHHVAARGRVYIDGARIDIRNLDKEYKSRNVDAIIRSNPMFFV